MNADTGSAIRLGPYTMNPWRVMSFSDVNAEWIWSRGLAQQGAPSTGSVTCWTAITVRMPTNINIFAAADDEADIIVNDKYIGTVIM